MFASIKIFKFRLQAHNDRRNSMKHPELETYCLLDNKGFKMMNESRTDSLYLGSHAITALSVAGELRD